MREQFFKINNLKNAATIIAGGLILLFAAYINGSPILYSDTSTYISSGFQMETPFDRPIFYGLFLRFSSLNGLSLWLVILAQSTLLSALLYKTFKVLLPSHKNLKKYFLLTLLFLATSTSVSWTSSQLISDIFTPIIILTLFLLLVKTHSTLASVLLYLLFFVSTAMHMSHVSMNILILLLLLIIRNVKYFKSQGYFKLKPIIICLLLSGLSIATMGSALSKSKHVFLMGALVEHGIAKKYLDEHCESSNYKLCEYKDSLPEKAWQFIWEEDSPFYKVGGWKETKEEFNDIIGGTFSSPKYIGLHIKESFKASADQLTKFKIGDGNGPYRSETKLHERISLYFKNDISMVNHSKQNNQGFGFLPNYNLLLQIIIVISSLVILFLLTQFKGISKELQLFVLLTLIGIFINAVVCGTFANAIDRLGAKVIWMLPLVVVIFILGKRENGVGN